MKKKALFLTLLATGAVVSTVAVFGAKKDLSTAYGTGGHIESHHVIEKKVFAPGYYQQNTETGVTEICSNQPTSYAYGEKAHWYCLECNKHFADAECSTELALTDFQIAPFTSATLDEVATGDLIANNRVDKQKNVDQGISATYVKDAGRVASFISRSNVSSLTEDTTGSELRFVFDSTNTTTVNGVSFRYRFYDVGTETTSVGDGQSHSFIQLTDQSSVYKGYNAGLVNDDAWHVMTIDTAERDVGAVIFKVIGLRGYLMISDLALKTVNDDILYDAGSKQYKDNVWTQVEGVNATDAQYGNIKEFTLSTSAANFGVGPGNIQANKFTVDSSIYESLKISVFIPSTVTKYNVTSIAWGATVGTADRETLVSGATQTGWVTFTLKASYYPTGFKVLQFTTVAGSSAGTWKASSVYGVKPFNSTPAKTVITQGQMLEYASSAENCVVTGVTDPNRGYLTSLARTGVASKIYVDPNKIDLTNTTSLEFDIFIPNSYTVWFFNFVNTAAIQVTPRYADSTLVTGWVHVTVLKETYPAIWTGGIKAIQINNVGTNGDAMLLSEIVAR